MGLTTHELTEISDLGNLYGVMQISKTTTIYIDMLKDVFKNHVCWTIVSMWFGDLYGRSENASPIVSQTPHIIVKW